MNKFEFVGIAVFATLFVPFFGHYFENLVCFQPLFFSEILIIGLIMVFAVFVLRRIYGSSEEKFCLFFRKHKKSFSFFCIGWCSASY